MASLTQWTWVWVNSGSWWWIGRPGVLQFMGSQRVGHDWATEHIYRSRGLVCDLWGDHHSAHHSLFSHCALCTWPLVTLPHRYWRDLLTLPCFLITCHFLSYVPWVRHLQILFLSTGIFPESADRNRMTSLEIFPWSRLYMIIKFVLFKLCFVYFPCFMPFSSKMSFSRNSLFYWHYQ